MLIFVMRILCVVYAHTMRGYKSSGITLAEGKAIIILSLIRNKPFVTTKELAEKLELSERTIQR